ncbi:MAG: hypothetical protein PHI36_10345 [Bacteroidales bacterium]|nr:hypothetical protein [Bacteroidales bacterium]
MKIKIAKDLYVNSNTLVRFEWRKYYPVLVVHEKFEKILKWILRIIAVGGIATSVISIPIWYLSLGLALVIALIEQFFERTIFEYTTMVIQPFPDFELDYGQWKTNGFMIPIEKNDKYPAHFGPSYLDESYATDIFRYFKSWIDNSSDEDKDNSLIVSLIIEPNEEYTTYIYANLGRKRLDNMFKLMGDVSRLEKYGKRQQQFITQMFYWNTLDFKEGYNIKKFLEFREENEPYYFTPSVLQPFGLPPKFLTNLSIKKYHLKIKKREDLLKNDPEYQFDPAKQKKEKKTKNQSETNFLEPDIFRDIEKSLSNPVDVGFMPNQGKSVGVINLCYDGDCVLEYEAYKHLMNEVNNKEVIFKIIDNGEYINVTIMLPSKGRELQLNKLSYNKVDLEKFLKVNGGGNRVALLVGYPPANERKIILGKEMSPIVITWEYEKRMPAANKG